MSALDVQVPQNFGSIQEVDPPLGSIVCTKGVPESGIVGFHFCCALSGVWDGLGKEYEIKRM